MPKQTFQSGQSGKIQKSKKKKRGRPKKSEYHRKTMQERKPIFLIQKHDTNGVHYDFRLEIGGYLKSWMIPDGPSLAPSERRRALEMEEKSFEGISFEGYLPDGDHGEGLVMMWDHGTYKNLGKEKENDVSIEKMYEGGEVRVFLEGEKLRGGFMLLCPDMEETNPERREWILIKIKDKEADARKKPINSQPKSVLSGKTLEQMKREFRKANR
ncbi:MAG TPA: DNA polymerase ligase N-terminal domain-containing protein [Candidatus Paceibacterota bacterium]|nr:DNA polymerase ligase N-terminal domain-containing protein [Candidatus Paceibacterota bacterium]